MKISRRGLAIGSLLVLTGCAGSPGTTIPDSPAPSSPSAADNYPVTVTIGSGEVTVNTKPKAVVAASSDAAALLLTVAPGSLLAIPGSASHGPYAEAAKQVQHQLSQNATDPEQLLALNPDLVVLTARHDDEKDVAGMLTSSGVPAVVLTPKDFAGPKAMAATITALGEVLGEAETAQHVVAEMDSDVTLAEQNAAGITTPPRVLGLMTRGDKIMTTGQHTTLTILAKQAGGAVIAEEKGWTSAVPIDVETLASTSPDVILIEDFQGKGREPFDDLLTNPALAEVPAIAQGRVHLLPDGQVSASGGPHITKGLVAISQLLSQ